MIGQDRYGGFPAMIQKSCWSPPDPLPPVAPIQELRQLHRTTRRSHAALRSSYSSLPETRAADPGPKCRRGDQRCVAAFPPFRYLSKGRIGITLKIRQEADENEILYARSQGQRLPPRRVLLVRTGELCAESAADHPWGFFTSVGRQATYSRGEHALARCAQATSTPRDNPGGRADDKSQCGVNLL